MRAWLALLIVLPATAGLAAAATTSVSVGDFFFSPANIVISAGDTVEWSWSGSYYPHSVVYTSGASGTACTARTSGSCAVTFSSFGVVGYKCGLHPAMTGTIKNKDLPDLRVTGITWTDTGSVPNAVRHFSIAVKNFGVGSAGASSTRLAIGSPIAAERTVGDATTPALAGGATANVVLDWAMGARAGDFTARAISDVRAAVPELVETNNEFSRTTTVIVPLLPGIPVNTV